MELDCEKMSGPVPLTGSSDMLATARKPQAGIQTSNAMPVTFGQQQASAPTGVWGDNVAERSIPTSQEVMSFIAFRCFQPVDPSKPEQLNGFLKYLTDVRKVVVVDQQQGSLIITVECSSLEILEGLWEDYRTGFLNAMAQTYLVTEDILNEFGLIEVRLMTTILEDEYRACRDHFLHKPGKNERLYQQAVPILFSISVSFSPGLLLS